MPSEHELRTAADRLGVDFDVLLAEAGKALPDELPCDCGECEALRLEIVLLCDERDTASHNARHYAAECERLERENAELRERFAKAVLDRNRLAAECCEAKGDAGEFAAFLVSDRAPGESSWKSPPVSMGSRIAHIISQYESLD